MRHGLYVSKLNAVGLNSCTSYCPSTRLIMLNTCQNPTLPCVAPLGLII